MMSLLNELLEERAYLWNVDDKSYHLKDVRALNEMDECLDYIAKGFYLNLFAIQQHPHYRKIP